MKIVVCGSMSSAEKMIKIKKELTSFGHDVILPSNTEHYASGKIPLEDSGESTENKIKFDLIREYYIEIGDADAVLIVNIDKNGVENYIGGNAFLELSFGHVLNKKLFLLNPIPNMIYVDEIMAMQPIVLNGDLEKIKPTKKKIMIGGSMVFAPEMKKAKLFLENEGFEVSVPLDTEHVINDPSKKTDVVFMKELGVGRGDAELVAKADALLILNYEKHGTQGYIGPGAYRDISVSWWLKRKLFFLYPYDENQNNHKYEMLGFEPEVLFGDLSKIKEKMK